MIFCCIIYMYIFFLVPKIGLYSAIVELISHIYLLLKLKIKLHLDVSYSEHISHTFSTKSEDIQRIVWAPCPGQYHSKDHLSYGIDLRLR